MGDATVSAIIPTYNRSGQFLRRSIGSALSQTYPCMEIVVVDDNENSSLSLEIECICSESRRTIYIKAPTHMGANAARNLGIKVSSGNCIAFLDDDDTWEPNKTERQLKLMTSGVGMVYCMGTTINSRIFPHEVKPYNNYKHFKQEFTFAELLRQNYIGCTSQALISRKCFDECGLFNELLPARQDYDMWLRISKRFRVVGAAEMLFTHYLHDEDQITKSSKRSLEAYQRIYKTYKTDYQKDKLAASNIMTRISRAYRMERRYLSWMLYCFYAVFLNPKQYKGIISRSMENKTI